jgi:hypothetical protein
MRNRIYTYLHLSADTEKKIEAARIKSKNSNVTKGCFYIRKKGIRTQGPFDSQRSNREGCSVTADTSVFLRAIFPLLVLNTKGQKRIYAL